MAPQWRASITHIDPVAKLLRTLIGEKVAKAQLFISSSGLKAQTVAPSRVGTAQLFLEASLFTFYECTASNNQPLSVVLSVSALVNCLLMFSEWNERFSDSGYLDSVSKGRDKRSPCFFELNGDHELKLSFANESMTSVCALKLLALDDGAGMPEIAFARDDVAVQAIMPAVRCAAWLRDLEAIQAVEMGVQVRLDPPQLEIGGVGELAQVDMVLKNEAGVLDALVAENTQKYAYSFAAVSACLDAVKMARKVSLRIDSAGTLSVQCLCQFKELSAYVEFRVLANI